MSDNETEDILAHYGVLGMQWGVRKDEASAHINVTDPATGKKSKIAYDPTKVSLSREANGDIRIKGTNKKAIASVTRQLNAAKSHPDHDIARETLRRSLPGVSNKDLKRTNERLQLEKQYSQLRYERSTVGKGQAHVKTTLALVGTGAAAGLTISKLATPENINLAKKGLAFTQRVFKNPEAYMRAVRVAKLATKVVK